MGPPLTLKDALGMMGLPFHQYPMRLTQKFFARVQLFPLVFSLIFGPTLSVIPVFVPIAEAAALSITAATGGSTIDATTTGGTYTSLTGPALNEGAAGQIGVGTIILNVPAGFEFDTGGTAPTVKLTAGSSTASNNTNHLANNAVAPVDSVTSTQITFTITFVSSSSDKLTWQDIRVRPTAFSPLASGDIVASGTASVSGVTGTTNLGTLTEVGVTVTPATGGSAIDAGTVGGTFTSLTGPIINEAYAPGEIGAGTLVLNVPAGFEFDTGGTAPTVRMDRTAGSGPNSCNINGAADNSQLSVTSTTTTQITFTVISASTDARTCSATLRNRLTWQNVRVRPTAVSPLASGDLLMSGTSSVAGVTGSTSFGTLTEASVTITPATGGSAISDATVGGAYTTLTGPVLAESANGDIGENGAGTIILNAPAGFEFDTGGTAPTVLITRIGGTGANSRNINDRASGFVEAITSRTSATITFTVAHASSNGVTNSLTWQDIRVRPTAAVPLASGNITKSGVSTIVGVNSSTNLGTLTEVASVVSTTTAVTADINPSTYGTSVTFTATVTGSSPTGSVEFFDGATSLGTAALSGGSTTLSTSALAVGSHSITGVYSGDGGNATSTSPALTQVVNKATLTVTADAASRDYGDANPGFTASYGGFQNGEVLGTSGVTGAPSLTTLATPTSSVAGNPYTITAALGTLAASNYDFAFVDGALTINTATLTVSADSTSRAYGAANPGFTASYGGFQNGEVLGTSGVAGAPSLTTLATPSSSVPGPYTITAALGTLTATNYDFAFVDGLLTISLASTNTSTVLSSPNSSVIR